MTEHFLPTASPDARKVAIEALASLSCDPRLLDKTRRATRMAALAILQRRRRFRRHLMIAFAVLCSILLLCSPVIWAGVEAMTAGEVFASVPVEMSLYVLLLIPAMLSALILVWWSQRGQRQRHRL